MKIHELGKKLNIEVKAILGYLSSKGYKGLDADSEVPESMVQKIKEHFTPLAAVEKKADAPKAVALPDFRVKKV